MKFVDYNSFEKEILLDFFKNIPMMDNWVACIVESYIYAYAEEYYDNGQLKRKYRTKYGERDGEYKEWDGNGQLMLQVTFVNGKEHGKYKEWWFNGVIKEVVKYLHGKAHGKYKRWWLNGKVKSLGTYVKGKLHGDYKEWNEYGKLEEEGRYVKGKKDGEYTCYNGRTTRVDTYKCGKLNGETRIYFNGVLESFYVYEDNKLVELKRWDNSGKLEQHTHHFN